MAYEAKHGNRITRWLDPVEKTGSSYGFISNSEWIDIERKRIEEVSGCKTEIKTNKKGEVSLWRVK